MAYLSVPPTFKTPKFTESLDLEKELAQVPAEAKTRGVFINGIKKLAASHDAELRPTRKHYAFKQYALTEFMEIAADAAQAIWPNVSHREGLRRLGHTVYTDFFESRTGKVLYGMLGRDIVRVFKQSAAGYSVALTHGTCEILELDQSHTRIRYENVHNFLDSYHLGILEGTIAACDHVARIGVLYDSPTSGEVYASWIPSVNYEARLAG